MPSAGIEPLPRCGDACPAKGGPVTTGPPLGPWGTRYSSPPSVAARSSSSYDPPDLQRCGGFHSKLWGGPRNHAVSPASSEAMRLSRRRRGDAGREAGRRPEPSPQRGKPEHPVGVRKRAQQSMIHIVARARRKEGECAQQRQIRDGESRVRAGTAQEGNTCKGNVLVPMEAMADRLQGSESGSGGAGEAKRPQPQDK